MNLGYFHGIAASLNVAVEPVAAWKYPWDTFTYWSYHCETLHSRENKLLFWALLEHQSFGGWIWPGIWNSVVWREMENHQTGKQRNQNVLNLKKCKWGRKLGQKRETGGQHFVAKELFSQLRIRGNGWIGCRKWDRLIHGRSHELKRGPSQDHWPKPTEGSRVVNFGTELHTALLPFHLSLFLALVRMKADNL